MECNRNLRNGQCVHWVANVLHSSEENSFYGEKVCMTW